MSCEDDNGGWCTILSDPAVFTELLAQTGVIDAQVEELYALDPALFASLAPIHGLVFLFRYRPDERAKAAARQGTVHNPSPPSVFFANQLIANSCATQALISVVLNAPALDPGPELRNFKTFTKDFDSFTRGLAVSNSDLLRTVHNSFAPQHQFIVENSPLEKEEKEEPYHFVAFMPIDGKVWELDGLQAGPREHSAFGAGTPHEDWLALASDLISARMAEYSEQGEIRFTLLAVVDDIGKRLQKELSTLPADAYGQRTAVSRALEQEKNKREQWSTENARRRHNFVPFIVQLLKAVGEAGLMDNLLEMATARKQDMAAEGEAKKTNQ
jgi:ubiquitin carboxyl-terminal hydrolase L5